MSANNYIVSLDQGTTSSRTVVYDLTGREVAVASEPLAIEFPQDGWVEQDPNQIWKTQLQTLKSAVAGIDPKQIRAIGITNQRETTLCWDRKSGEPLAPAIVWQCRRSADICTRLQTDGLEEAVRQKTGLVIDAYFSSTKIHWMLEHIDGLKEKVKNGDAVFGTVDTWLIFKLTEGKSFLTEPSNASRTMLYHLEDGDWDDELLAQFSLTRDNVAEVRASNASFGETSVLGVPIPITGVLGDQQSSLFGHGCTEPSSAKCTFGTGAFLLMNVGDKRLHSSTGLLGTVGWNVVGETGGSTAYALEGSIFMAGALIQWLRDNMGLIASSAESEDKARAVTDSGGVIIVPAFVGLGAPHWDSSARGAIFGLTRETNENHIVRAALEGICHQVADVFDAEEFKDTEAISIDGGMIENKLFCQLLADMTGKTIQVAASPEMTAFGAAKMAALGAGVHGGLDTLSAEFQLTSDHPRQSFLPGIDREVAEELRVVWHRAVERTGGWV